ncbi:hypothetical protein Hanom_Chr12g01132771 [Helianthus anomalus]
MQYKHIITNLPLSVHIENNSLITGGINDRPKRILIDLRNHTDNHRRTRGLQTRSHRQIPQFVGGFTTRRFH